MARSLSATNCYNSGEPQLDAIVFSKPHHIVLDTYISRCYSAGDREVMG
jgi:hypothetical protein